MTEVRFPVWGGKGYFSLRHRVQTGSGSHPASYLMGTGSFSPALKWPEREADHSPPSSVEVKNVWSRTFIPEYLFMVWCLIKHRVRSHNVVLR
jgi:hypothetical protein